MMNVNKKANSTENENDNGNNNSMTDETLFKMNRLLNNKYFCHEHWQHRIRKQFELEEFCHTIIDATKIHGGKHILLAQKECAISQLLNYLKKYGLSLHSSSLDANILDPGKVFEQMILSNQMVSNTLETTATSNVKGYLQWVIGMSSKSYDYFYRNVRILCQLRTRRLSPHKDIATQSSKCHSVTENLFRYIVSQRDEISQLLLQIGTLKQWQANLKSVSKDKEMEQFNDVFVEGDEAIVSVSQNLTVVEKCLKVLKEIYQKLIVQGNKEFGQHLKIVEDLYNNQLNILINELNDIKLTKLGKQDCQRCLGKEYYLPYWSIGCHKKLIRIDDELHAIAAQLKLLPFYPSLASNISRMSNLRDKNNFSIGGNNSMNEEKNAGKEVSIMEEEWKTNFDACYQQCKVELQLCIQDGINMTKEISTNVSDTYSKDIKMQHLSVMASIKSFRGKRVCQCLVQLIEYLNQQPKYANDESVMSSIQSLTGMIASVTEIGIFIFNHNIQTHKSFNKLEYILINLFNNLFLKGYCRKEDANENEDSGDMENDDTGGNDGGVGTGTGMGEGTGIEDVSHEMENEGQVEGLQDDDDNNQQDQQNKQDKNDKDEKDNDNDDGGIDMSHADFDFGGELFDLDNKNEDNEDGKNERENDNIDEEDDEDDDIDCELGNFNESQQLDEQMWSAPDKKDEEKGDNKQDEKDKNEGKEDDNQDDDDNILNGNNAKSTEENDAGDRGDDDNKDDKNNNRDTNVNEQDDAVDDDAMDGNDDKNNDAQHDNKANENEADSRSDKRSRDSQMVGKNDNDDKLEDDFDMDGMPDDEEEDNENENKMNEKMDKNEMKLEFCDELSDLDDNVSQDDATSVKSFGSDDNENELDNEDGDNNMNQELMKKGMKFNGDDIEMEDNDMDDNNDDDNKDLDGEDDKKLDEFEKDLESQEKAREEERMEDLNRGNGEIMQPPSATNDDGNENEIEFLEDSDYDSQEDNDNENENENDSARSDDDDEVEDDGILDLEKKHNENGDNSDNEDSKENEENKDKNKEDTLMEEEDILRPHLADEEKDNKNKKEKDKKEKNKATEENKQDNMDIESEDTKNNKLDNQMDDPNMENMDGNMDNQDDINDEVDDELNEMGIRDGMGDSAFCNQNDNDSGADNDDNDQQEMNDDKRANNMEKNNQNSSGQEGEEENGENENDWQIKSNPFDDLGDALSEWKQKLEMIEPSKRKDEQDNNKDDNSKEDINVNKHQDDVDMDNMEDVDDETDNKNDNYATISDDIEIENAKQALGNENDSDDDDSDDENDNDNDLASFAQKLAQISNEDPELNDAENVHDSDTEYDTDSDVSDISNMNKNGDAGVDGNESDDENKQEDNQDFGGNLDAINDDHVEYLKQLLSEKMEAMDKEMREKQNKRNNKQDSGKIEMKRDDNEIIDQEDAKQVDDDLMAAIEDEDNNNNNDDDGLELALQLQGNVSGGDNSDLWRQLTLLTDSLSNQLCEQLRTILEPLMKSKLGGDFKSGKRINMKKIIPYIASQFRKDKIWLRRNVPNKRNYQILICIDDSMSMKENNACLMALESLCILSQALTKLEIGNVGVISFGNNVKILHDISRQDPIGAHNGNNILHQFTFNQEQTNYRHLLANVINVLAQAQAQNEMKSRAQQQSDTFSLAFIISDGRIQEDRDKLAQLIRVATFRKQVILMIIIDDVKNNKEDGNERNKNELININSIEFDKQTGKVIQRKYFDNFPFPYYILLNDTKILPNVVSDALRQWFELIPQ